MPASLESGGDPSGSAPRRHLYPGERRLLLRSDFERVRLAGRTVQDGNLRIAYLAGGSRPAARLGLAIGRRAGNSPERNRLKRWIREWFRTRPGAFPDGVDIVVVAKRPARELNAALIAASLELLAARIAGEVSRRGAGE